MGKLDKEQEARMAGMAYALGIAEKKGIDGLRKELQMRGALNPSNNTLWKHHDNSIISTGR